MWLLLGRDWLPLLASVLNKVGIRRKETILEKVFKKNWSLELPRELLEKAHLLGRVNIIVGENEIIIKKVSEEVTAPKKMVGLGKGIFDKDSVTLQRELREEWS